MLEKNFNISLAANLARHEKQIQQNYRPIIAVHKWFARLPGTLFRSLLLSEYTEMPLEQSYYADHQFHDLHIADPFMGGGTPLVEANRLGMDVTGYDVNPMSCWIVKQELADLDLQDYRKISADLVGELTAMVGDYYTTTCTHCGNERAPVKYYLWIKTMDCSACKGEITLYPGLLIAGNARHTHHVMLCPQCGAINEVEDHLHPRNCRNCHRELILTNKAARNRCLCPHCGQTNRYPQPLQPPRHRMIALEYYCPECKPTHAGRYFKSPDANDLRKYQAAENHLRSINAQYIPRDEIPSGDETSRLHKWGYHYFYEMFNSRQLLGLELSCRLIGALKASAVKEALATNLSDLLRYQNMLCRYDVQALKSLDIFSVHGFPVGLIQCESNLLGISNGNGVNIGSGGWTNITEKYIKAKHYCTHPFEIKHDRGKKAVVPCATEVIGEYNPHTRHQRRVNLVCASSTQAELATATLDGVFTDPPYFANVQYAELMDFCYIWLRKLMPGHEWFQPANTRNEEELTVNTTQLRGIMEYTAGVSQVFTRMTTALKLGKPFVFSYHHNQIDAYIPLAIAMLDAGLVCSACYPCPAEMSASIHINKTDSSVLDTIFICRTTGSTKRKTITKNTAAIASLVADDIELLLASGMKPTPGDIRCIAYGHIIRLCVWYLRQDWDKNLDWAGKIEVLKDMIGQLGNGEDMALRLTSLSRENSPEWVINAPDSTWGDDLSDEISF